MAPTTSGAEQMRGAPEQLTLMPDHVLRRNEAAPRVAVAGVAGEGFHAGGNHAADHIEIDLVVCGVEAIFGMDADHEAGIRTGHAGVGGRLKMGDDFIGRERLIGGRGKQRSGRGYMQE